MPNYIIKDGVFYVIDEMRGEYVVEWLNNVKFTIMILALILRAVIAVIALVLAAYFLWRWGVPGATDLHAAIAIAALALAAISSRP